MADSSLQAASPPSASIINLAIADLAIYAGLIPVTVWITWKHGKTGMVCWPIFISYFALRFVADIYQVIHRNDPQQYNQVVILTNSGSLACLSLTIIGLIYEANMLLPLPAKSRKEKIYLGVTHLANTGGIAVATYGGAPSPDPASPGGVVAQNLNQIGNCLMLFVMFAICWWMWPTWKRICRVPNHPNFPNARMLLVATAVAMPFQIVRLAASTTYAFAKPPSIDPVTGTFAARFILVFLMQLGVALAAIWGGWASRDFVPRAHLTGDDLILRGMKPRCECNCADNRAHSAHDGRMAPPESWAPEEQQTSRSMAV